MYSSNETKVINYFNKKKYYNSGFLRSSYWNRRIKNLLLGDATNYERKKIFQNLLKYGFFYKQQTLQNSYIYQFVGKKKNKIISEREYTISFD